MSAISFGFLKRKASVLSTAKPCAGIGLGVIIRYSSGISPLPCGNGRNTSFLEGGPVKELFTLWWPVFLVVGADVAYQICDKTLSSHKSPLAALGITYVVSAFLCALLFEVLVPEGHILAEILSAHPAAFLVGISITGLEVGSIYMYRVGWAMNIGFIVYTALASAALLLAGCFFYGESLSALQLLGLILASVGMFCIVR